MNNKYLILLFLFLIISCSEDNQHTDEQIDIPVDSANYLALGDSYTIGQSVAVKFRWPNQLADSLEKYGIELEPKFIAKTGWRTDDLINAINDAELEDDYEVVSLLIGVNNQFQRKPIPQYEQEFDILIKKSIALTKDNEAKRVLVLSIPDYGYTPFGESNQEQISQELDNYNNINKNISENYGVWYVDITPISRNNSYELVSEDTLHPSGYQYSLWVDKIMENEQFIEYLQQELN